jgi:hypothetical protein
VFQGNKRSLQAWVRRTQAPEETAPTGTFKPKSEDDYVAVGDARLDRGSSARQRARRPNAATTFGSVAKSCSVRASAASITSRATSLASASASRRFVPA